MNKEQAISVLIQVAEVAQSKGILKLGESAVVFQAVTLLTQESNQTEELAETNQAQPEETKNTKNN
jgi:hypothetical protein